MDSVSLETSLENEWIKQRVVNEKVGLRKNKIYLAKTTLKRKTKS